MTYLLRATVFALAIVVSAAALGAKFPTVSGTSGPLILGTDAVPAYGGTGGHTVTIVQDEVFVDTIIYRASGDNAPNLLSMVRSRGTKEAPAPVPMNAFVNELRFGYMHKGEPPHSEGWVFGGTIDNFAGYGPPGKNGYGGYFRIRTTPAGSNVPLTVLVLQQSAAQAANYLSVWNAKAGGDVVLQATPTQPPFTAGFNFQTGNGAKVRANGVPLINEAEFNALKARVVALEAR